MCHKESEFVENSYRAFLFLFCEGRQTSWLRFSIFSQGKKVAGIG